MATARALVRTRSRVRTRAKKDKGMGIGKEHGQVQAQEKGAKNKKNTEKCKKTPGTWVKDDYVKRAKNRLKAIKKPMIMVWAR